MKENFIGYLCAFFVCVDNYEHEVPKGRIVNSQNKVEIAFHGTVDFLKKMEALLRETNFPQPFAENRSFRSRPDHRTVTASSNTGKTGNLATFSLKVLFRQNSSWQGAVTWMEGNQEMSFRSVLELLLLMDSALIAHHQPDK